MGLVLEFVHHQRHRRKEARMVRDGHVSPNVRLQRRAGQRRSKHGGYIRMTPRERAARSAAAVARNKKLKYRMGSIIKKRLASFAKRKNLSLNRKPRPVHH